MTLRASAQEKAGRLSSRGSGKLQGAGGRRDALQEKLTARLPILDSGLCPSPHDIFLPFLSFLLSFLYSSFSSLFSVLPPHGSMLTSHLPSPPQPHCLPSRTPHPCLPVFPPFPSPTIAPTVCCVFLHLSLRIWGNFRFQVFTG